MKSVKKSTESQKAKNNWSLISCLTLWIYIGSLVALGAIANLAPTILFQPPPQEEQPESTEGAASRHHKKCAQDVLVSRQEVALGDHLNLTAVVPDSNYGLTIADRPTFWVYLPKTSAQQAILSIKEENENPNWQQSINLTREAGITGIKLSDDAPALEIGKNYQWAVILVCGKRPNPNDPVVAAWIKRVDESKVIDSQLPAKTMLEKAAWYAQKGIWYDPLDILSQAQQSSMDNWHDIWVKYLQSAGLDEIANEPFVGAIRESPLR